MALTNLRVTPELLVKQANIIEDDIICMRNEISQISSIVMETSVYWLGEAGNKQRVDYDDNIQNINNMLERLSQNPIKLLQMAELYSEAEGIAKRIAASGAADVQLK